jgi:hypothetical protein
MTFLELARHWVAPAARDVTVLADLETLERDGTAQRLRALAATLTPTERDRLAAEAAEGDPLAGLIAATVAGTATETG